MSDSFTPDATPALIPDPVALRGLLERWGTPPAAIVSKLPKGGTALDFVGHADITRILISEDPLWSWEPAGWEGGEPIITKAGKHWRMWGHVTVHGKTVLAVGTCEERKDEFEKELVGDLLRNGAMRLGICLSLWSKAEWEDTDLVVDPLLRPVVRAEAGAQLTAAYVAAGFEKGEAQQLARDLFTGAGGGVSVPAGVLADLLVEAAAAVPAPVVEAEPAVEVDPEPAVEVETASDAIKPATVKRIKVLQKQLAVADEAYRARLDSLFGVESCTELSEVQGLELVGLLTKARTQDGLGQDAGWSTTAPEDES